MNNDDKEFHIRVVLEVLAELRDKAGEYSSEVADEALLDYSVGVVSSMAKG